ncbi:hypothetical protein VCRA2126O85_10083 [Vibrio crassostreae]|nr:hypothetical protein VCRA2128O100_10083 [Vibrio crassostreae]CAK2694108.1 hypothetical protein VCRA2128O106_10083 [Vibrio crassostreae]CAK2695075.1 hypothetical protein VCRA2125O83_10083 [Vibrio crassostreae]CAK2698479.1 hypothetical protein VCRA2126O86_10083 [Vibrio crassostreae]CAK2702068.1 hypothetical protein VCRA2126O85_10083 [Vibrio crassostreae]
MPPILSNMLLDPSDGRVPKILRLLCLLDFVLVRRVYLLSE